MARVCFVGTSGVLLWGGFRRGWSRHQDAFGDALGWEKRGGRGPEGVQCAEGGSEPDMVCVLGVGKIIFR